MTSYPLLKVDETVFASAQENMDYDLTLIAQCEAVKCPRIFRVYSWPNAGITLARRQAVPRQLTHIDTGFRPTGGGIVFHSPGDIVFSLTTLLDDPVYPKPLKEKIGFITLKISKALMGVGIETQVQSHQASEENLDFCKTYFSPHELYHNGQKICGLTFKRYKQKGLLQGVLHLHSGVDQFQKLVDKEMYQFLTSQKIIVDQQRLINALMSEFKRTS